MKFTQILLSFCLTAHANLTGTTTKNNSGTNHYPLTFTENKGQFADQHYQPRPDVLFGGTDGQITFHITNKGISYQQYRVDSYKQAEDPKTEEKRYEIDQQTIYRTDIKWVNANANPLVLTDEALPGSNNYYLEQCPNGAIDVKSHRGVTLQNIYNNIDLHYYESEGHLKCDYIIAPHTDYKQIQLKVEGAILKLQNDGSLLIETPLGMIQEQAPIVYQNGKRLEAQYKINNNQIGFEIKNYNINYELIIDPVTRLWGTYYGGSGDEDNRSCATDTYGNVYLAGQTASAFSTLIATLGSHQSVYGGGPYDAFLVKFNGNGVRLWATYYGGGNGNDFGYSCCTDISGNVYMAGYTGNNSGTVIATQGSHQGIYGGGNYDAFLVKFDSGGIRSWGTFYGGAGFDYAHSCSVDGSGNVYVAGLASGTSSTALVTPGCHQSVFGGGYMDAFLAKFDSNGNRLWGTYYGGPGDDQGESCPVDPSGNVYLAGLTGNSTGTIIATAGSHQSSSGGVDDAFLVKFNGSGSRLWGTYYGEIGSELFSYCATDTFGNVYLLGSTSFYTGTAIATTAAHQSSFGGGSWDTFLAKFNSSGVRQWGTYYGGSGDDKGHFCATDASGNVYIVGFTNSNNSTTIANMGSHQSVYGGGANDGFFVKFSSSGVRDWGTYYGGSGEDRIYSCATNTSGFIYISGIASTNAGTAIATPNSHQNAYGGAASDAFLIKFADCTFLNQIPSISGPVSVCSSVNQSYSVTNNPSATSYNWNLPGGWTGTSFSNTISATPGSTGVFTVTAINNCGTSPQATLHVTVNQTPSISVNSGSLCSGKIFTIIPSGANSYTISGGSFTVSPNVTTTYSVTGSDLSGCVSALALSNVTVHLTPSLTVNSGTICSGSNFIIIPSGANTYTISGGTFTVSPTTTNSYSVTGTGSAGCVSETTVSKVTISDCTGLNEGINVLNVKSVVIYPNPSSGQLTIETGEDANVKIIDIQGRMMAHFNIKGGVNSSPVDQLLNGVYFVEVVGVHGKQVFRIIKQ
jgi:hypothetical protein